GNYLMKKIDLADASPLEAHLGFWLRFVSNHVSSRFSRLLESQNLSVTEWVAMRTLYQCPEVRHADLIDALGMTKGAASKVISRLEEKALAERRVSPESSREQVLCLTAKGMRLVPELSALADENDEFFFAH